MNRSANQIRAALTVRQEHAAERFIEDWVRAGNAGLNMPASGADAESHHVGHLRLTVAQHTLELASKTLGERDFEICVGVLILSANATQIHSLCGGNDRSEGDDIDIALNKLVEFYEQSPRAAGTPP